MNIGIIGCGSIGKAIIGGIIRSEYIKPEYVIAADHFESNVQDMVNTYGVKGTCENRVLAEAADILILSVKPNQSDALIQEIKAFVKPGVIIVSVMAGKSVADIKASFGKDIKVVRTMPNTPALVNAGMTAICQAEDVTEQEMTVIKGIFDSFGETAFVPERLMDAVVGISGSSPAYAFIFIEAMADAGVRGGLSRKDAYRFASQSLLGAAKMVLETGKHPGELKDMVCSPGGTTIEAVAVLEAEGMRSAVVKAVEACIKKSEDLGKQ